MKNPMIYLIPAIILGVWVILPDPLPVVVDDILAALGSAAAVLLLCRSEKTG